MIGMELLEGNDQSRWVRMNCVGCGQDNVTATFAKFALPVQNPTKRALKDVQILEWLLLWLCA